MVELKKSPNDGRSYKRIVLENGLHALLIHDPEIPIHESKSPSHNEDDAMSDEKGDVESEDEDETSKDAAASLTVGVGSASDPSNIQGMAHYLEHMLFMGSEKFPNENEYDDFLSQNGGLSNAYTDMADTVYFFSVRGAALHGALDRFAQFFVAPLCLEDAMEREVLAVDSEFALYTQKDNWRLQGVMSSSAPKDSLYHQFSIGNKKSIFDDPKASGVRVREELLKFYKTQYSAERMCLTVLGGHSLEQLETWVMDLFSEVTSGLGASTDLAKTARPFEGQRFYLLPSIKQLNEIVVSFQLPSLVEAYRKKSEHYLSHLIGHEGPGSLLSELKAMTPPVFEVSITVTDAGLQAAPGYGLAPITLLFQYIAMIKEFTPQKWIYDEIKIMNETTFRFLEECDSADYVHQLSREMHLVRPGDELISKYLYDEWDPAHVEELLSSMRPFADGFRIDLQTMNFDRLKMQLQSHSSSIFSSVEEQWERWFEFQYMQCVLHQEFLDSMVNAPKPKELTLPPKNLYLPENFDMKPDTVSQNGHKTTDINPDLLANGKGLRVWHKQDTIHKTPKIYVNFQLSGPMAQETEQAAWSCSPHRAALSMLLVDVIEDILGEEFYMAEMAGLICHLTWTGQCIDMTFGGFSEKLPVFIKTIFNEITNLKINDQVFGNMKEELVRKSSNANVQVSHHVRYTRQHAILPSMWHIEEILGELQTLQLCDIKEHLSFILRDVFIETLFYGNILADEAHDLAEEIRRMLGNCSFLGKERRLSRCLKLPSGNRCIQYPTKNPNERNSGINAYFQCGQDELIARTRMDFIEQLCNEPCFNILRTQEQLGYIVGSRGHKTQGVLGFAITIISERFPPTYLEKRLEEFLGAFEEILREISVESFEQHRSSLIEAKLEKDKSLKDTFSRLWGHIATRQYDFDVRLKEVQVLKKLTKQDLLDWYALYLSPTKADRKKLSVGIICPKHREQSETTEFSKEYLKIEDLSAFRSQSEQYPDPSASLA